MDGIEQARRTVLRPRGLVDLRGREVRADRLHYPRGAVVVVSGLPGSGKSTLLRAWSPGVLLVDPRDVREAYQARMPARIPYAVYRPWARLAYVRRLREALATGQPLLVHDCGSRPWIRRWLARSAASQGRELHVVMLDVSAADALAGQEARGRWVPARVFARHHRRLTRLVRHLGASPEPAEQGIAPVPDSLSEAASVLVLDRALRGRFTTIGFDRTHEAPAPSLPAPRPEVTGRPATTAFRRPPCPGTSATRPAAAPPPR
ncbi:AAA family ATPase [Streptomyces goshikiensis]|uniref:AAA family ATPase n=1 Tax=Streptomyces goshikiensis TaxID=1942 RepID=UPI003828E176